jgi:hypothetical protein
MSASGGDGGDSELIMVKRMNRVPPGLKHDIDSGIGRLPIEAPAESLKVEQEVFDERAPVGRSEKHSADGISP